MGEHTVIPANELDDGDRIVVELEGRDVGIFRIDGEYHAYTSWCPHQGGPMCEGPISGTTSASYDRESLEETLQWVRDGRILVCPWHGWQFDLQTGEGIHDDRFRLISHSVREEDGYIVVTL